MRPSFYLNSWNQNWRGEVGFKGFTTSLRLYDPGVVVGDGDRSLFLRIPSCPQFLNNNSSVPQKIGTPAQPLISQKVAQDPAAASALGNLL